MSTAIPAWVNGVLTPVEKLEVHRRGLRHKAVSVFLTCGGEILLQRRALGKYHTPGLWANTCCTHPLWDETPAACARRRLREELGLAGLDPAFRHRLEYRADVGGGLTEHELVLWAWEPGVDANGTPREKPPVPKEEYIQAVKEWAAAGAPPEATPSWRWPKRSRQ